SVELLGALSRSRLTRRARRLYKNLARVARQHLRLLERFGRYPHRNALLGRESSPEERRELEHGAAPRFVRSVRAHAAPQEGGATAAEALEREAVVPLRVLV